MKSSMVFDSLTVTVRTEKKHIAYATFIIESYEGIAVVTTADPEAGLLRILVAPDFEQAFMLMAKSLGEEIPFTVLAA